MNIASKAGYPAGALSNFSPHPFEIDGVRCNSMEGFLQSLKFKNPDMQAYVCTLVGSTAKAKGKDKNWKTSQILYWRGVEINRHSDEYQTLLDRAYDALFQNQSFRAALAATGDAIFTHTMGKSKPQDTVLTVREFCSRLHKLRNKLDNK